MSAEYDMCLMCDDGVMNLPGALGTQIQKDTASIAVTLLNTLPFRQNLMESPMESEKAW